MNTGKHQRNKQRCQNLCWKVYDPAQTFVLCSYTMLELRNQYVGWFLSNRLSTEYSVQGKEL